MSRRHSAEKREIIPDPKYGDVVLTKFMNSIMYEGKKSTAERIVYGAFDIVENRARANPIEVFRAALDNVAPMIEQIAKRSTGRGITNPRRRNKRQDEWLTRHNHVQHHSMPLQSSTRSICSDCW